VKGGQILKSRHDRQEGEGMARGGDREKVKGTAAFL